MQANRKTLLRYVLPSVASMLVNFLYVVVDGIFVGRGVGTNALAAVNIAMPYTTAVIALVSMLIMGAASVTAIRMGRGDVDGANDAFMTGNVLVLLVSLATTALGVLWPEAVARVSGASPVLMADTVNYIRYYSLFIVVNSFAMVFSTFVRNDGMPILSFVGMVAGALANVFLDWLFVFPLGMGVVGAAIASGLGQFVALFILVMPFVRKRGALRIRRVRLTRGLVGKVFARGLPELVTQLSQPVTTLCYNYVVLRAMGEIGVAAFSVISYLLTLILGVFLGVSQGIQPLIGNAFGCGDRDGERYTLRAGLLINTVLSVLVYGGLLLGGRGVIGLFNPDGEMIRIAYGALRVYGFSFVLASVNIVLTTYFFSTKRTGYAVAIAVARGLSLNILFILAMPALLGPDSMWYAMIAAELGALLLGVGLLARGRAQAASRTLPANAH